MTSRVCSKNKEKKAKRKNSVKKIDQQGQKITVQRKRKQHRRDKLGYGSGVEPGLSARARNSMTTAPQ